jgi:hypothetical protein
MFSERISLGGNKYIGVDISYITKKGYYLNVYPFELEKIGGCAMVSRDIWAGKSYLLKQVARKSKKAEQEAEEIAIEKYNELVKLYA